MRKILVVVVLLSGLFSCEKKKPDTATTAAPSVQAPLFNADSAYSYVSRQVGFGPRVPNTASHRKAADFFVGKFKEFGSEVTVQSFEAVTFDGMRVELSNIIASFNPTKSRRILLAAHWDTRPYADKDKEHQDAPFDGANDGASGVGVLLEIARVLAKNQPAVGVDIILFDGEDGGEKESMAGQVPLPAGLNNWWCLGSQHWSKTRHKPGYTAYYGILLDMVGGKDARFYRDEVSMQYAPRIVDKVWNAAERLGFGSTFLRQNTGALIDDHRFVNEIARIPMIDIVAFDPEINSFGDFHHTTKDNLNIISKEKLQIVGKTVLQVVFEEPG